MKTLIQVAVVASVVLMLSITSYAAGQTPTPRYEFPPMVLPVAGPAVTPAISPGPAPAASPTPMAVPAPAAEPRHLNRRIGAIFTKAREAFVRADLKLAALEVRRGAAVLRKEEYKANGDVRKELAATALDLDLLASRIEQSKVKAGSELDTAFARADQALAENGKVMAKTAGDLKTTTPGPGITATAARQGMPSRQPVNAALATPPEKPIQGSAGSYEELNKRIEALSKEITELRTELNTLNSHEAGMKH